MPLTSLDTTPEVASRQRRAINAPCARWVDNASNEQGAMATTKRKKWNRRSRESSMFGSAKAPDPFPISRSKLEAFHGCPRCFWIDRVAGVGRPGIPAFTLNSQVDTLLKREFDVHRAAGTPHPYMAGHGLGHMVPLDHAMMDAWRNNRKGVRTQKHGFELFGAVDDIWKSGEGADEEWYVVDYKSTATNTELTAELFLVDIYKGAYVRQMAIYQWLLRELGHPVSTRGFFVYENGNNSADSLLSGGPEDSPRGIPLRPVTIIEIDTADHSVVIEGERIDLDWVENLVMSARACLGLDEPPAPGEYCEYCAYSSASSSI